MLTTFETLGVENELTDFDLGLFKFHANSLDGVPDLLFQLQAKKALEITNVFLRHHKMKSLTFWGFTDAHTYKTTSDRTDYPLLFDSNLRPKPMVDAMLRAAK